MQTRVNARYEPMLTSWLSAVSGSTPAATATTLPVMMVLKWGVRKRGCTRPNISGVLIAASDYVKALPDSIDRWLPRALVSLGTDGFGRSENRASLREFFEVDHRYVVVATLSALARDKKIDPKVAQDAIAALNINPEKANPAIS